MTFQELNLSAPVLRAVREAGYETPSPIQAAAIPPVLAGRDLMGCAQTGTGKTAAFALPMLERLAAAPARKKGAVRALILTPTRELALQIGESFDAYGKYKKLRCAVIFGGVGQAPQVAALKKGVEILVACPGRLNDLLGQGLVDLSFVEIFVLDEADRMLDMGFVHDVKKVIARLPAQRQTLMFSATMPTEIEQLAAGILHDPAFVKVDPVSSTVDRIQQSLYFVEKANKKLLLPWLIQNLDPPVQNALVFSRTKHGADKIARDLVKQGIPAAAIHGNKSQSARVAALEGFKAGRTRVLVATDIAARGIDISELSHVFNYDLPEVPETYVHRIGRTARAGADGTAVSFCTPEEQEYLAGIEKLNRRRIPVVTGHPWEFLPTPQQPNKKRKEGTVMDDTQRKRAAQSAEAVEAPAREGGRRSRRPRREPAAEQAPLRGSNAQPKFDPHFVSAPETPPLRPARKPPQSAAPKAPSAAQSKAPGESAPARGSRGNTAPAASKNERPARNGRSGTAQPAPKNQPAAPKAPPVPPQNNPSESAPRGRRGGQFSAGQGAGRSTPPPTPARAPRAPKPEPAPRRSRAAARDDDPGLVLISRRPPQQKFSSFEEYMAAHGGATAPIEDHTGEE